MEIVLLVCVILVIMILRLDNKNDQNVRRISELERILGVRYTNNENGEKWDYEYKCQKDRNWSSGD